jgi:hypothetical protein
LRLLSNLFVKFDSYYVLPIHISLLCSELLKGSPLNPELEVSAIGQRTHGGGIERFLHCLMSLPKSDPGPHNLCSEQGLASDAAVRGRILEGFEEFERELIDELRQRGPSPSRELNIMRRYGKAGTKLLKKARDTLERRGLLLARPITHGEHLHDTLLELWETRFSKPMSNARGIEPLLLMCLRISGGPVPR